MVINKVRKQEMPHLM